MAGLAAIVILANSRSTTFRQPSSTQMCHSAEQQSQVCLGARKFGKYHWGEGHFRLREWGETASALECACCSARSKGLSRHSFPVLQGSNSMALFIFKPATNNLLGNNGNVLEGLLTWKNIQSFCVCCHACVKNEFTIFKIERIIN